MKRVRSTKARSHYRRILRPQDLESRGVEHKGESLIFEGANGHEIVMSNKMSDSLVAAFPGEFLVFDVDGDDEPASAPEPLTSNANPDSLVGAPDASVSDLVASADESTPSKAKNK